MPVDVDSLAEKLEGVRRAVREAGTAHQHAVEDLAALKDTVAGFERDLHAWLVTFDRAVVPHIEAVVQWVDKRSMSYKFGTSVEAVRSHADRLTHRYPSPLRELRTTVAKAAGEFTAETQRWQELSPVLDGAKEWLDGLAMGVTVQLKTAAAMRTSDVSVAAGHLGQIESWLSARLGEVWGVRGPLVHYDVGRAEPPVNFTFSHGPMPHRVVASATGEVHVRMDSARRVAAALAQSPTFAAKD